MTDACNADRPAVDPERLRTMWTTGWRRYVFPGFWLIYLTQTVTGVNKHHSGIVAIVGYAIVVAFAATYLVALTAGMGHRLQVFWRCYALGLLLTVAECFFAHEDALVFLVYVSVLTMATRRRWALPLVGTFAATAAFLPPAVPSWHAGIGWDLGLTLLLVSLAMFGFFKIIEANQQLSLARAEVARLAAENERTRIARDLHDLLGHSLTTITVKAGLARKLAERDDHDRARTEITEVEQLARRTLGDVRAAVSAHREMTLSGELATAREVLRASGIIAELPASVAEVDPDVDELFGWVVREGVTNAVRHSRAEHLRVVLSRRSLEISDDGRGGSAPMGNGLTGLTERVADHGGVLVTHTDGSNGFTLRVELPDPAVAPPSPAVTT